MPRQAQGRFSGLVMLSIPGIGQLSSVHTHAVTIVQLRAQRREDH